MINAASTTPKTKTTWISPRQASDFLKQENVFVDKKTIERWAKRGLIRYIQLPNGYRRVDLDEIKDIATPRRATPNQHA